MLTDSGLDTSDQALAWVEDAVLEQRAADAKLVLGVAAWADLHPPADYDNRPAWAMRSNRHPAELAGEGTPPVDPDAHPELAISLRVHPLASRRLMADVLDLRHRFPNLWTQVIDLLELPWWVARKVTSRTRHLSQGEAALIDLDLTPLVALPAVRFLERLDSLVMLADAKTADADRERELRDRFVTFNRSTRHGTKGLWAKLDATDAVIGDARIDQLARILKEMDRRAAETAAAEAGTAGAETIKLDTLTVYRAKALGLMIRDTAQATRLLFGSTGTAGMAVSADATGSGDGGPAGPASPSGTAATVVVHVHVDSTTAFTPGANGVARLESGGPLTLAALHEFLRHQRVVIKPVLDPRRTAPADSYEFTGTLREAVLTRTPADVYPYGVNTTHGMDLDHTEPYRDNAGGGPGPTSRRQTRADNAGPMTRPHHNIKTRGLLQVRQPLPDVYVWRTPHHRYRLTDSTGTHELDPQLGRALFTDPSSDEYQRAVAALRAA